jgi:hypothetical protein
VVAGERRTVSNMKNRLSKGCREVSYRGRVEGVFSGDLIEASLRR